MRKPKTEFGQKVSVFLAETGMTTEELAEGAKVKCTTLRATMTGKTPGHDLTPAVYDYMDRYRKEARVG